MSRKSKIDPVLKVQLVEQYLRDEIGVREAGRLAGLSGNGTDSFRKWSYGVNSTGRNAASKLLKYANKQTLPDSTVPEFRK